MFFDTCRTRIRVMAFTPGWSCKARCTVPVDIPRASAISKRVTRRVVLMVSSRNQRTEPKVSTCPQASCRGSVNDSGHYSRLTKAKWARNFLLATGRVNFHALQGLAKAGLFQGAKDRKSTRLNSSHVAISYAVFCLKKKKKKNK